MQLLPRDATAALRRLARGFPAVAVTGPRQSGKTTLVRATFPSKMYVSLEDPDERALALDDPRAFLGRFARSYHPTAGVAAGSQSSPSASS